MRSLESINKDIERCENQIAASYEHGEPISEEMQTVIEGFQQQLDKLKNELSDAKRIRNITVVNPRIVPIDETNFLGI